MNETDVSEYFDTEADQYTHDGDVDGVDFWPIVDGFIDDRCTEGDRIVEIGCGDGFLLEYTLEATDVTEAYGMDISAGMLPDSNDDVRATYLQGSATDLPLPFRPESVDFVVLSDVLHHLVADHRPQSKVKAQAALVGAVTLLRPGGYLILKDIYYESPIGPDALTSYAIFYGLKYFIGIASMIDEEATDGLLVSFYTEDELVGMLEQAGTSVVRKEVEPRDPDSLPRNLLVGDAGCIRLYAKKQPRGRDADVR